MNNYQTSYFLFAIKRIEKYEEITYEYAIDIKSFNKAKYNLIDCKCAKNAVKRFLFES
jgi:SET domain-containing protein